MSKRLSASLTCWNWSRGITTARFRSGVRVRTASAVRMPYASMPQHAGLQKAGARCRRQITVEPLLGLKIVKDLIVDMEPFFDNFKKVLPYFINDSPLPTDGKERLQSPEQRARFDETTKCILCAACTTSCPSFWGSDDYSALPPWSPRTASSSTAATKPLLNA